MRNLVNKLIEKNKTISTMESCTGGGVANYITNIEGASEVLKFSAVTYSNEYKIKMGVSKDTIDKYSVYSKEVAIEMSRCISAYTNSDYGIGITGKLNRADKNNLYGNDNQVFVSIYDRENDINYDYDIYVDRESRELNKVLVIELIEDRMLEILSQKVYYDKKY